MTTPLDDVEAEKAGSGESGSTSPPRSFTPPASTPEEPSPSTGSGGGVAGPYSFAYTGNADPPVKVEVTPRGVALMAYQRRIAQEKEDESRRRGEGKGS